MTEAAAQLDLEMLSEDRDIHKLIPRGKQQPLYKRDTARPSLFILLISWTILFVRFLIPPFQTIYPVIILILLPIMYLRRDKIKDIYLLHEDGLQVPYTWFYRRKIPYENIIRIIDDKIENENTGEEFAAIRIVLDTPLLKYNITGLQSPNILLSTKLYNSHDLNAFADELTKKKQKITEPPNTLAQRIEDQVNRAWGGRWNLIMFNVFDSTSEILIYILTIEALIYGIVEFSILDNIGLIIIVLFMLMVFLVQLYNKPQAIIAIRPKEVGGPLIYDEEELITTIRFIVMCKPHTVHLRKCSIIYEEGATKQVSKMKQIHPTYVEPGELTYAVAQMLGNHTKAVGANIRFTYKETEDEKDKIYELPIKWA